MIVKLISWLYIHLSLILSSSSILASFPIFPNLSWTPQVLQSTTVVGRIQRWSPRFSPSGVHACVILHLWVRAGPMNLMRWSIITPLVRVCYVANLITLCYNSFHHRRPERDRKSDRCVPLGLEESKQHCCEWPIRAMCQGSSEPLGADN